jgi:hypothetical protein
MRSHCVREGIGLLGDQWLDPDDRKYDCMVRTRPIVDDSVVALSNGMVRWVMTAEDAQDAPCEEQGGNAVETPLQGVKPGAKSCWDEFERSTVFLF